MQELKGQNLIVEVVRAGVVIGSAIGEVSGDDVAFEVCCRRCHTTHQCTCLTDHPVNVLNATPPRPAAEGSHTCASGA